MCFLKLSSQKVLGVSLKQGSASHSLVTAMVVGPDDFTKVSNSESSFTDANGSRKLAVLTGLSTKSN